MSPSSSRRSDGAGRRVPDVLAVEQLLHHVAGVDAAHRRSPGRWRTTRPGADGIDGQHAVHGPVAGGDPHAGGQLGVLGENRRAHQVAPLDVGEPASPTGRRAHRPWAPRPLGTGTSTTEAHVDEPHARGCRSPAPPPTGTCRSRPASRRCWPRTRGSGGGRGSISASRRADRSPLDLVLEVAELGGQLGRGVGQGGRNRPSRGRGSTESSRRLASPAMALSFCTSATRSGWLVGVRSRSCWPWSTVSRMTWPTSDAAPERAATDSSWRRSPAPAAPAGARGWSPGGGPGRSWLGQADVGDGRAGGQVDQLGVGPGPVDGRGARRIVRRRSGQLRTPGAGPTRRRPPGRQRPQEPAAALHRAAAGTGRSAPK